MTEDEKAKLISAIAIGSEEDTREALEVVRSVLYNSNPTSEDLIALGAKLNVAAASSVVWSYALGHGLFDDARFSAFITIARLVAVGHSEEVKLSGYLSMRLVKDSVCKIMSYQKLGVSLAKGVISGDGDNSKELTIPMVGSWRLRCFDENGVGVMYLQSPARKTWKLGLGTIDIWFLMLMETQTAAARKIEKLKGQTLRQEAREWCAMRDRSRWLELAIRRVARGLEFIDKELTFVDRVEGGKIVWCEISFARRSFYVILHPEREVEVRVLLGIEGEVPTVVGREDAIDWTPFFRYLHQSRYATRMTRQTHLFGG